MNIWYINHYATPPLYGLPGRPYAFATNLEKLGHKVTVICAMWHPFRQHPAPLNDQYNCRNYDGVDYCYLPARPYHPEPNHIDAQPNKIFEYMSAGIPVIASDFPLWGEIIEGNECGICIDPLNQEEIAEAVQFIIEHPAEAEQMGTNGRRVVEERYNWDVEEKKLLGFYEEIRGQKAEV